MTFVRVRATAFPTCCRPPSSLPGFSREHPCRKAGFLKCKAERAELLLSWSIVVSRQHGTECDMALSVTWHCQHCRADSAFRVPPLPQAVLQGPHPILGLLQGAPCSLGLLEPLAPAKHHLAKSPAREQKQRAPATGQGAGGGCSSLHSSSPALETSRE